MNINYLAECLQTRAGVPVPVSTQSRFIIAQLGINFTLFSCFCSAEVLSLSCHAATWRPPPRRGRAGFFLPDKKLIVSVHIICTEPGLCLPFHSQHDHCKMDNWGLHKTCVHTRTNRWRRWDRCCHKIDNYFTDCTFKIVLMRTTMRQLLFVIFAKYLQICDPDIFANIDITIYQADIKSILWFMLHDKILKLWWIRDSAHYWLSKMLLFRKEVNA